MASFLLHKKAAEDKWRKEEDEETRMRRSSNCASLVDMVRWLATTTKECCSIYGDLEFEIMQAPTQES